MSICLGGSSLKNGLPTPWTSIRDIETISSLFSGMTSIDIIGNEVSELGIRPLELTRFIPQAWGRHGGATETVISVECNTGVICILLINHLELSPGSSGQAERSDQAVRLGTKELASFSPAEIEYDPAARIVAR
jgi:hypothetical protein